jgi:S-adenosylmethionine synthetase
MPHFVFSSESVGEGHPDKMADYISDSILDACLAQDPKSRVACETLVKSNLVCIAGEITTRAELNFDQIVRQAIRETGYTDQGSSFNADTAFIHCAITRQSPDIAQGVDATEAEGKSTAEQGAGDQGIMFGYACDHTPEFMPMPIMLAHKINRALAEARQQKRCEWLKPDCKSQVAVAYDEGRPVAIQNIIISTQHAPSVSHEEITRFCKQEIIPKVIPQHLLKPDTEYFINPTGKFIVGGPEGDAGLTGRKIIVDTYGGWAHHGGGAFSGKDPSKVDRSAAYMCRWVAKNIVAAGLAREVELQVAYAIGHPNPTSICVNTYGTSSYTSSMLVQAIQAVFSFKPADIIRELGLLQPIYRKTTHYGHFTKQDLPWEKINRVEALKEAIQIADRNHNAILNRNLAAVKIENS